jgi:hypothetical protein
MFMFSTAVVLQTAWSNRRFTKAYDWRANDGWSVEYHMDIGLLLTFEGHMRYLDACMICQI